MPLLEVKNLKTWFPGEYGTVKAVDGVDLVVEPGEIVGMVGESGSGKSVFNLTLMGLVPSPPALVSADALFIQGEDLRNAPAERWRQLRGNRVAMIFQDPMTSLNPFLTIGDQISEPLLVHRGASRGAAKKAALALLDEVGIPDPERCARSYPHQFSGGMRQRVMIAMALVCEPLLLIADEPTTALDVTVQAQILELLEQLRNRHGTAIILVTHDLGVAAETCERVCVMYAGKMVERASVHELFASPLHPYSRALMESVPRLDDPSRGRLRPIQGSPPDLTRLPAGCSFAPRCDFVVPKCREIEPPLQFVDGSPGRARACHVDPAVVARTPSARGGAE